MNNEILETTEGAVTEKTNILTQSDTLITNTHSHDTIRSQRNKDKKTGMETLKNTRSSIRRCEHLRTATSLWTIHTQE